MKRLSGNNNVESIPKVSCTTTAGSAVATIQLVTEREKQKLFNELKKSDVDLNDVMPILNRLSDSNNIRTDANISDTTAGSAGGLDQWLIEGEKQKLLDEWEKIFVDWNEVMRILLKKKIAQNLDAMRGSSHYIMHAGKMRQNRLFYK